jgi:hypothetical protein
MTSEMQDLLLTIIIGVMALVLALIGCLLLGGKERRVSIAAILLMMLMIPSLFVIRIPMTSNYYGFLGAEALFAFALPVCCLIAAWSSWLEWLSPPPQWKTRAYRERSIFDGCCLTLASIGLAFIFLPRVTAIIPDMATGPSIEMGVVEQLNSVQTRGGVSGGNFIVHGASYFTANLPWYNTLSVGQSVRFAYGPKSHYGFPADQMILTPWGMAVPALVVGFVLLFFSAGYHILKPSERPANPSRSKKYNPFEQITDDVIEYRKTKGAGPFILLMILPLLFLGLVLLFLVLK